MTDRLDEDMLFDIIQCICQDKIWESKYKLEMIVELLRLNSIAVGDKGN